MGRQTLEGILRVIEQHRLFAVIRTDTAEQAVGAGLAAHEGGVRILEVTWTVTGAAQALAALRERLPGALVGAGTILTVEQAEQAAAAGAQFIVGPSTQEDVIVFCKQRGLLVAPGALTPTEVVRAHNLGAEIVKIFPAAQVGGPAYVKALRGPLPHLRLMPTGGVNPENIPAYLEAGAFALGSGANLVDPKAAAEGRFGAITENARAFVAAVARAG
jgi:2-dehydro-3-deoxyphosphogluconate aldolase/(4S)-4-hydroxy-2-oxoglutarate aldolase